MLDTLGLFVLFHLLHWLGGQKSEEHEAAQALSKVLEHQGAQNAAELKQAAAPASAPALLPQAATPAVDTAKGPATPAAAPAPFPAAVPATLPTFPDKWPGGQPAGWIYALPLRPEVINRAKALLSVLWSTGQGTHVVEMTGGQWTAYNAEWHDQAKTVKGVTAYKPAKAA
jgi:hypothetical protein